MENMDIVSKGNWSLPPLLDDDIQGRLDVIILRPVLVPLLQSNQSLIFKFCWWGNSCLHNAILSPNEDEQKIVFDIRCNLDGLQKYFQDANDLEVEVYVSDESIHLDKHSPSKPMPRKVKEWKHGDSIGKFRISNLKLNTRGEYVNECNIYNAYGDHCGSVVVFMLFTSLEINKPKIDVNKFGTKKLDFSTKQIKTNIDESERSSDNRKPHRQLNLSSPAYIRPKTKLNRENLSPRFVPLEKTKKTPPRIETKKGILKGSERSSKSPQKEPVSRQLKVDNHIQISQASVLSTVDLSSSESSLYSFNQNFILTKLFSFVDSGAIRASDIPALIQICEGRSPSVDFSSLPVTEESLVSSVNESEIITGQSVFHSQEILRESGTIQSAQGNSSINSGTKKVVNFSGVSYAESDCVSPIINRNHEAYVKKPISNKPRLDKREVVTNATKLDMNKIDAHSAYGCVQVPNKLAKEFEEKREHDSSTLLKKESSLIILKLHSIQLDEHYFSDGHQVFEKGTPKKISNNLVRQRSKLCYFVETFFEFEEELSDSNLSALFISRHIQDQEIIFNGTQIIRLRNTDVRSCCGILNFKVSRRRLGNRLREVIGLGRVSLRSLYENNEDNEVSVALPFWHVNDEPNNRPRDSLNQHKPPIGALHFSVTFALVDVDPNYSDNIRERSFLGGNLSSLTLPQTHSQDHRYRLKENISEKSKPDLGTLQPEMNLQENKNQPTGSTEHVFIPIQETTNESESLEQEVYLEIIEGNALPLLKIRNTGKAISPSPYVRADVSSLALQTPIYKNSASPRWNFSSSFKLSPDDLHQTDNYLILKVFHCLDGSDSHPHDPMLGFAAIDTRFLWNSFVSLCGWIPVLNLQGEICGEIKVSLTPKRLRSWFNLPQKEMLSFVYNRDETNTSCKPAPNHNHDYHPSLTGERILVKPSNSVSKTKILSDHLVDYGDVSTCLNTTFISSSDTPSEQKLIEIVDIQCDSTQNRNQSSGSNLNTEGLNDSPKIIVVKESNTAPISKRISSSRNSHDSPINSSIEELPNLNTLHLSEGNKYKKSGYICNEERTELHALTSDTNRDSIESSNSVKENEVTASPKRKTTESTKASIYHVIEGLQWMNHGESFDSPCVSYIDLKTNQIRKSNEMNVANPLLCSGNTAKKTRKNRLAANFEFPLDI